MYLSPQLHSAHSSKNSPWNLLSEEHRLRIQEFPRDGVDNSPRGVGQPIIWQTFCRKLHENERNCILYWVDSYQIYLQFILSFLCQKCLFPQLKAKDLNLYILLRWWIFSPLSHHWPIFFSISWCLFWRKLEKLGCMDWWHPKRVGLFFRNLHFSQKGQWLIQGFSSGVAHPRGGCQPILWPIMKMKMHRVEGRVPCRPLDLSLLCAHERNASIFRDKTCCWLK